MTTQNENKPKREIPEKYKQFFKSTTTELAGSEVTCMYRKSLDVKTKALKSGFTGVVTKRSIFRIIVGVDYLSLESVKEKHESGERERVGLSPNVEKIDIGVYHNITKDKWLLGATPVEGSNHETVFEVDGVEVALDDVVHTVDDVTFTLKDILYAADLKSKDGVDWLMLPVENIIELSYAFKDLP